MKHDKASEQRQKIHRIINSALIILLAIAAALGYFAGPTVYENYRYETEIAQLVSDEGYRGTVYKDSLGYDTIGFGHLIKPGEDHTKITPHVAIDMLRHDYAMARANVESKYSWAEGEVKLVLINMSYQLGPTRLDNFEKMLTALESGDYDLAAAEMLDSKWAKQTPHRAGRLAGRILSLSSAWW